MESHDHARERLLQEGAGTYLDALVALRAFREEVSRSSRRVLQRSLPNLAEALGVPLSSDAIEDFARPRLDPPQAAKDSRDWAGNHAWLSVCLKISSLGTLYAGLVWEWEEDKVRMWLIVDLELKSRDLFTKCWNEARQLGGTHLGRGEQWKEIWFREPLARATSTSIDQGLEEMLALWVAFWKHVGGIEGIKHAT
jgi:hypothetical protein